MRVVSHLGAREAQFWRICYVHVSRVGASSASLGKSTAMSTSRFQTLGLDAAQHCWVYRFCGERIIGVFELEILYRDGGAASYVEVVLVCGREKSCFRTEVLFRVSSRRNNQIWVQRLPGVTQLQVGIFSFSSNWLCFLEFCNAQVASMRRLGFNSFSCWVSRVRVVVFAGFVFDLALD